MEEEKKEEVSKSRKSNKLVVVIVVAALFLIGLGILGRFLARKIAGSILSRITGNKVSVENNNNLTVGDGDNALSVKGEGALPDNFPKDFPTYPGAKITGSFSAQGESGQGVSVVWETKDAVEKVNAFYKSEMVKAGYKISATMSTQESATLSFEKDLASGFIGITKSDSKTTISVTLGTKGK